MKANGIYSALTLSFFLHIAFFTLFFYIGREFYTRKPTMSYSVSLVFPTQTAGQEETSQAAAKETVEQKAEQKVEKQSGKPSVQVHTETRHKNIDTSIVKDRIEELKAIQRLEKLASLRKIVDIGATRRALQSKYTTDSERKTGSGGTSSGGDYYAIVKDKIEQQWIFPDTLRADLEMIVSIKIAPGGSVIIEKVERGSGNALFDRSVLRAINMASPLPPPLKEMEIALRFNPLQLGTTGRGR